MRNWKRLSVVVFAVLMAVSVAALGFSEDTVLKMATTTSTDATGLLDYLAPILKQDLGIELKWTAVGTGKALELGRNGDVDVVLVHDPDAEKKFMDEGFGIDRKEFMYNDFVLVGDPSDPAKVKGVGLNEAMKAIADSKSVFASRADKSGTHSKELLLWKAAGIAIPDKESWYIQVGQGMLETLAIATEKKGYTLTDRATYTKYEANNNGNPPLVILVEGDPSLRNQYSVMSVNPEKIKNAKHDLALKFIEWLTSDKVLQLIADFKLQGKQIFFINGK